MTCRVITVDMRFKVIVSLATTASCSAPLLPLSNLVPIDVMLISSCS